MLSVYILLFFANLMGFQKEIQTDATDSVPADGVNNAPIIFRLAHRFLYILVNIFFREIEVVGLEHVPKNRGGVIVSWHPNGMIDPGLIIAALPRRIVYGARHGLFKWPIWASIMRSIGTVPIQSGEVSNSSQVRKKNVASLNQLAQKIAQGSLTALFPEGISHDAPYPIELKTGAARLYYQARSLQPEGTPPPLIIPVGLHYDQKRIFRSRALVRFHPPMELPEHLDVRPEEDEPESVARTRGRVLTSEIGRVLREVVLATADWKTHRLISRARSLMRAESAARSGHDPGPIRFSDMAKGFAQIRAGLIEKERTDPEEVDRLIDRIAKYHEEMVRLGLEDQDLDRSPKLVRPWISLVGQMLLVFLLMPPLLLWGYIVNGPSALLLVLLAKIGGTTQSDEASIKVLFGAVVFPATWVGIGFLAGMGYLELQNQFPDLPDTAVLHGILVSFLSIVGGVLALRWLHLARETMRSVRVRIVRARRKDVLHRLRYERADLHDALLELRKSLKSAQMKEEGRTSFTRRRKEGPHFPANS